MEKQRNLFSHLNKEICIIIIIISHHITSFLLNYIEQNTQTAQNLILVVKRDTLSAKLSK